MKTFPGNIDLEKLDFTANDSVVYGFLVKEGPSPAGVIIAKTDLHRNIVYTSLDHLIKRKLVTEKKAGNKTVYAAITPDILVTEYSAKQKMAEKLLSEFKRTQSNQTSQEISIHEGNEEFMRLLESLVSTMPKGSTKYVLGSGGELFMRHTMLLLWEQYHKVAADADIKIKMLGYTPQRFSIEPHVKPMGMYDVRYIDSETKNPAGIHIYPELDTVLNIIYSSEFMPVTAIRIKNKALTEGYLNLFNNLWKTAKP